MSEARKPVNRGFRFDIRKGADGSWDWTLRDQYGKSVAFSSKTFPRQHEAGKDCWKVQEGLCGYVQTFVNGKELKK